VTVSDVTRSFCRRGFCSILDKVARRLTLITRSHSFPKSLFSSLLTSHLETLSFLSGAPLIDRLHDIRLYIHRRSVLGVVILVRLHLSATNSVQYLPFCDSIGSTVHVHHPSAIRADTSTRADTRPSAIASIPSTSHHGHYIHCRPTIQSSRRHHLLCSVPL